MQLLLSSVLMISAVIRTSGLLRGYRGGSSKLISRTANWSSTLSTDTTSTTSDSSSSPSRNAKALLDVRAIMSSEGVDCFVVPSDDLSTLPLTSGAGSLSAMHIVLRKIATSFDVSTQSATRLNAA
jgi:hypothetical protein